MIWHNVTALQALEQLQSNMDTGLTVGQVQQRLQEYGANRARRSEPDDAFGTGFDRRYRIAAAVAAAVSLLLMLVRLYRVARGQETLTADVWAYPAVLVPLVTGWVLRKAARRRMHRDLHTWEERDILYTRLLRDGEEVIRPVSEVVPGDILLLQPDELIVADARILESNGLWCRQEAVTGIADPAEKRAQDVLPQITPLAQRTNMVYAGCVVAAGTGCAVVTETGQAVQFCSLSGKADHREDPRRQEFLRVARHVLPAAAVLAAVLWIVGWACAGEPWTPLPVAAAFAAGCAGVWWDVLYRVAHLRTLWRMTQQRATFRDEHALEQTAGVTTILTDKTGALTSDKMSVSAFVVGDRRFGFGDAEPQGVQLLLRLAALCCTGSVEIGAGGQKVVGDPTESAILAAAVRRRMYPDVLQAEYPRLQQVPFSSQRCRMSSLHMIETRYVLIVKGIPEAVFPHCVAGLTEGAQHAEQELRGEGLRVIAVAYRYLDDLPAELTEQDERELTLVGLLGLRDVPQEKVLDTVGICLDSGITPVMCTGDHPQAAAAMARRLGVAQQPEQLLTGEEADALSQEQLLARVPQVRVCARMSVPTRLRVLQAMQRSGQKVAATGSAVEDVALLHAADVGCAMGHTGTQPACDAADLIVHDDRFTTLLDAVMSGRHLYHRLWRALIYGIAVAGAGALTLLIGWLWQGRALLQPWQWLCVALIECPLLVEWIAGSARGTYRRQRRDGAVPILCAAVPLAAALLAAGLPLAWAPFAAFAAGTLVGALPLLFRGGE